MKTENGALGFGIRCRVLPCGAPAGASAISKHGAQLLTLGRAFRQSNVYEAQPLSHCKHISLPLETSGSSPCTSRAAHFVSRGDCADVSDEHAVSIFRVNLARIDVGGKS
jgi:hypothetical protein